MKKLLFILTILFVFIACEKQNDVIPTDASTVVSIELYGSFYGTFEHIQGIEFDLHNALDIDYSMTLNDNRESIKETLLGAFDGDAPFVGQIYLTTYELSQGEILNIKIENNLESHNAYIFANVFINGFKTKIYLDDYSEFKVQLSDKNITGLDIL